MDKKHIITIAGKLGSGKSSTAKKVAEMLGYVHHSTGDFMRIIANRKDISLEELSIIAEHDPSIDKELDDKNIEVGKMENVVLDSRLGFYFIPNAFKVFLDLDSETASERILKDKEINPNRNKETTEQFNTKESILNNINKRFYSERKRYKDLYGIEDHTSSDNFDLVINTKEFNLLEVSKKIIEEYNNWLNNK